MAGTEAGHDVLKVFNTTETILVFRSVAKTWMAGTAAGHDALRVFNTTETCPSGGRFVSQRRDQRCTPQRLITAPPQS
jgi:hypothetical protein